MDPAAAEVGVVSPVVTTRTNQLRPPFVPSWPTTCTRETTGEAGSPFSRVGRRGEGRALLNLRSATVLWGVHPSSSAGLPRCYGRKFPFQHDHRTCPTHKADTEAYKKAQGSKKRVSAKISEAKVEVSKDELSQLMMVGTELAEEIEEIKRACGPKPDKGKARDRHNKGKGRSRKKGDAVREVAAELDTPTTDAP